jgi:ubiquinol-cytochrome c reductase cytochrome b subunit
LARWFLAKKDRRVLQYLLNWLDDRTGVVTGIKSFLDEEIPASSGWHQVLGSVALFILLTQFATGVLMALNFAPQPGVSYASLQYIVNEIPGGRLIRGLHHWGASMMVVVVVLHMIQVAIWGAYKKPREATWLVGILLLLLTLAFSLTGYLLPWDNRAYWATVVTVHIAGLPPGGSMVQSLMGSPDGQVGIGAFQRFFTMHVMVLPAITLALAIFHVFLVRRHGIAAQPGDESRPKKHFYPEQVFKDTVAVFVAFAVLFGLAVLVDIPMEKVADPQDLSYVPRPEWYFLFLFETLKFFEGPWEVVGAVLLPTLAVLGLALIPFFDQGQIKRASQRFLAIGTVIALAMIWSGLTVAAMMTTPDNGGEEDAAATAGHADWTGLPPTALAGLYEFRQLDCAQCHNIAGGDPKAGPELSTGMDRPPEEWMARHFQDPSETGQDRGLSQPQVEHLIALVNSLTPANGSAVAKAPESPVLGAHVYASQQCVFCHLVNGEGQTVGPTLNGVGERRDGAWLSGHFREPTAFVEGSLMPPYDSLAEPEMEALVAYMLALKN